MSTIEDLNQKSISEMSVDEQLELIRQIRLSRRTSKSSPRKAAAMTKARKSAKQQPKLNAEEAKKLLALLGG